MRKLVLLTPLLILAFLTNGQIVDPVSWESTIIKTGEKQYDLIFQGEIDPGWSVYSQNIDPDAGPVPTTVNKLKGEYEFIEGGKECGGLESKMDPVWDLKIKKFHDKAIIIKRIKTQSETGTITGYLNFMSCDDEKCLPPSDFDYEYELSEVESIEDYSLDKACNSEYFSAVEEPENEGTGGFLTPDSWDYEIVELGDNTYELVFKATFDDGWHAYSIHTPEDGAGPVATKVVFDTTDFYSFVGDLKEEATKKKTHDDPFFEMELTTLGGVATLSQKVKVNDPSQDITGFYEYQVCDEKQCLPPAFKEFRFNISEGYAGLKNPETEVSIEENAVLGAGTTRGEGTPIYHEINYDNATFNCQDSTVSREVDETSGFWWIFGAGFLGGLIALLTPCVFPMIPLTVSFFTKSSKSGLSNAIIYGVSIIVIYISLGLLITGIAGPQALNHLSTNAWFNIFFFLLFVIFAFSFFGYFEITLPSSWINTSDKVADQGGLIGIFFMAFTLSLVSFSCTGPIIGTLLVETATGGGPMLFGYLPAGPLVGMFGFSLALALPFALFAAFPSWLNSLPRSGSWMNSVKVVLGFVEIALAFKFLSVADLTMGWKILPYELFIAVWFLCALGLVLYFFGILKFPHDSPIKKLGIGRISLGVIATALGIYFLTGFSYSDRSETFVTPAMLSGLAPPAGHSYIYPNKCPLNLNCFKDFDKGLAHARKVNKPIMLDFTGHGCVNCRKMEDQVWSKDEIYDILNDEYVVISLYVDERKELDEPYESAFDKDTARTVGDKWSDFQAIHFNRNTQPFYVLMDTDKKVLNQPRAYTPDAEVYQQWLECGLEQSQNTLLGELEE